MNVLDWSIPYQKHFEEMSRIPHGSYHEKAYSDYLAAFAKAHDLRYKQYEVGTILIYKDASPGYEDHPPVMLQAHLDMVCEKTPDSTHDFLKDPLELYIKDGWLRAKNTTLGADDGVGVAYILAILEDDSIPHPPLECVFTVQEEVTSEGVDVLQPEDISARRMIGLDDVGGTTTYVSSAGGISLKFSRPIVREDTAKAGYRLTVGGLSGGHSAFIADEKGSAIKIAVRILYGLSKLCGDLQLVSVDGGAASNAIPTDCEAVFVSDGPADKIRSFVDKLSKEIGRELEFSDKRLTVEIKSCAEPGRAIIPEETEALLNFFYLLPDGFRHKSMKIEGLTVASENLGTLHTGETEVSAQNLIRGALESYLTDMDQECRLLADLFGFRVEVLDHYSAWAYRDHSPMRSLLMDTYREITGRDLQPIAVHGGLECGHFSGMYPDMDIATIGPTVLDVHTVDEALSLESFARMYRVVLAMLKQL